MNKDRLDTKTIIDIEMTGGNIHAKALQEVWIEVNLDAIKRNIEAIQAHIPRKSKIMAVVKANAYGHGSVEVARQALESGATELAVASLEEGIVLRRAKIEAPILVLGFTPLDCVKKGCNLEN